MKLDIIQDCLSDVPLRRFLSESSWEEALMHPQDTLERRHLLSSLGTSGYPPKGAGGSGWEADGLGFPVKTDAPGPR